MPRHHRARPVVVDTLAPDPFVTITEATRRALNATDYPWGFTDGEGATLRPLEGRLRIWCPPPKPLAWSADEGVFLIDDRPEPCDSDGFTTVGSLAVAVLFCSAAWALILMSVLGAVAVAVRVFA